ncbi:hypothetical protein WJX82_000809 [Trebouxia sp. C0006]
MVRQEVDSDRLRTLRAELEQKTALLPAVLQTSNCIALVDHLTSVFKDTDWSSAARCLDVVHDAPADSSGWNHFQDFLTEDPDSAQGQAEIQAMDIALTEMQANIKGIQASTCLPPSRPGHAEPGPPQLVQPDRRSMHGSAAAGLQGQMPSQVVQASSGQQPTWNSQKGSSSVQGVPNPNAGPGNPNQALKPKHALGSCLHVVL